MADWLIISVALAGALAGALAFSAQLEVFRQLEEIRRHLSLDDEPMVVDAKPVDISTLLPPVAARAQESVLISLHSSCGTCRLVADSYTKVLDSIPDHVWFVIPAYDIERLEAFKHLVQTGRVIPDNHLQGIATATEIDVTPALIFVKEGVVDRAYGASSLAQVTKMVARFTSSQIGLEDNATEPGLPDRKVVKIVG